MNLAYSEAWASVFSMMAYEKSPYDYYPLVNKYISSVTAMIADSKSFSADVDSGEGQEDAIIALLWDIFGERNTKLLK
jgi:hypothetical protein